MCGSTPTSWITATSASAMSRRSSIGSIGSLPRRTWARQDRDRNHVQAIAQHPGHDRDVLDAVPGETGGQVDQRHVGLLLDLQQFRGEVVAFFGQLAPQTARSIPTASGGGCRANPHFYFFLPPLRPP